MQSFKEALLNARQAAVPVVIPMCGCALTKPDEVRSIVQRMNADPCLTFNEVAQEYGISARTLYRRIPQETVTPRIHKNSRAQRNHELSKEGKRWCPGSRRGQTEAHAVSQEEMIARRTGTPMTRCHACNRAAANRTYHIEIKIDAERYAKKLNNTRKYMKTKEGQAALQRAALRRQGRFENQFVEPVDREYVWTRDGGLCGICGEEAEPHDWHLDHIIPLARGGDHSHANVQVAHPRCNMVKHDKLPEEMGCIVS